MLNGAVLVAGGAGFVGSAIARDLVARNERVVVYDDFSCGHPDAVANLGPLVTVVEGDALDGRHLESVVEDQGVGSIINCVGDTFVPECYEEPERFFRVNTMACLSLLRLAKTCAIGRIVYVSSTEVYGIAGTQPIDESHTLDPVNTYAVSKLAADRLCHTFWIEHRVPVVIARIFNSYGPRATHPYVIPEIIRQFASGNVIHLGNTSAKRDFTYVEDTARALVDLLGSDVPAGEVVNVGSGGTTGIAELAHVIASIMGVDEPTIIADPSRLRRRDIDCFCCDSSKLRRWTDWAPRFTLHEGLAKTVHWFRSHGSRWCWEEHPAAPRMVSEATETNV